MKLYEAKYPEANDRTAESAEQDQTAHMYRLILLYALGHKSMATKGKVQKA